MTIIHLYLWKRCTKDVVRSVKNQVSCINKMNMFTLHLIPSIPRSALHTGRIALKALLTNCDVFFSPHVCVGINKQQLALWLEQHQALYSLHVVYGDVALWTVLMVLLFVGVGWASMQQRVDAGACNMHEATGQWRRKWIHFEYKCLGRVSAEWSALSWPPKAIVSWWPADSAKRLTVIQSTSTANGERYPLE